MITYFFKKVNLNINKLEDLNDYSLQQKYIQSFMPILEQVRDCKCPACKAVNKFSFHCKYNRNLSFVLNGEIVNYTVTVTRVICKSCLSTHALLPDFIVPYKIMSSCSICKIVNEAIKTSVLSISNKLNISYKLVYYYISLLMAFFAQVNILNNEKMYFSQLNKNIYLTEFIISCDPNFRYDYYHSYRWCFLMDKFRNYASCPIHIGMAKSRST